MKTTLYLLQSLLVMLYIACEGTSDPATNNNNVEVVIKNSELFVYNTGISGDEDGLSIKTQAKYFQVSEVVRNASTQFEAVYYYKSLSGFVGTDSVELEFQTGSDGASLPTKIESVKISIKVTE